MLTGADAGQAAGAGSGGAQGGQLGRAAGAGRGGAGSGGGRRAAGAGSGGGHVQVKKCHWSLLILTIL